MVKTCAIAWEESRAFLLWPGFAILCFYVLSGGIAYPYFPCKQVQGTAERKERRKSVTNADRKERLPP
jgi:hypothetical protein